MKSVIQQSEDIMGGTPVFAGTRVPVQTLLDYIAAGDTLDQFLADFPTVKREQIVLLFLQIKEKLSDLAA